MLSLAGYFNVRSPSSPDGGEELQELVKAAIGAAESGGVVGIYAIGGLAGVGKTALAVRAAYQILPEFPDGQLFADLHGYADGQPPAEPGGGGDVPAPRRRGRR